MSTYHAALRSHQVEPTTQDYVKELIIQEKKKGSPIFSWLFEYWARKYSKLLFLLKSLENKLSSLSC